MCTLNPERGLKLKIILYESKCFMVGSGVSRFYSETDEALVQILYYAIWITSQYLMHCVLWKIVCTTPVIWIQNATMWWSKHRITLCEMYNIRTEYVDGYIILFSRKRRMSMTNMIHLFNGCEWNSYFIQSEATLIPLGIVSVEGWRFIILMS